MIEENFGAETEESSLSNSNRSGGVFGFGASPLDGIHKNVRHHRHAEEAVEETQHVEKDPEPIWPVLLLLTRG